MAQWVERSLIQQAEDDGALARIGLADHDPFRWEALQWFVVFSQRDLGAATEGDWLLLTEEVQALLPLITHQRMRALLSRDDLRALQETASEVLIGLVDNNEAHIGTFPVTVLIRRGKGRVAGPSQIKRLGPLICSPAGPFAGVAGPFAGVIGPDGISGLMYHLGSLLMRFPETVQRCPKCHRLFARFRRHAKFCSRVCQSRVAARAVRDEDRRKKAEENKQRITKNRKKGAAR
jgi:hypothetical protein